MRTFDWTPEAIKALKNWRIEGHSCGVIGQRLGVSRCAVIGKLRRLGIVWGDVAKAHGRSKHSAVKTRKRTKREVAAANSSALGALRAVRKRLELDLDGHLARAPKARAPGPDAPLDGAKLVSVLDLERHHCRWPHGEGADIRFCGCPKAAGLPYCDHHAQRAYRSVEIARKAPDAFRRVA